MIKKAYYWLHRKSSPARERGEYSAGRWQERVRCLAAGLIGESKARVLEAGCGEGLFLEELLKLNNDFELYGIDIRPDLLERAKKRLGEKANLKQADACALPFENGYFDYTFCVNVFFNLPSFGVFSKVMDEAFRVTAKGGKVIFDIRNKLNPLLYVKYKLAPFYDETVKDLPLRTYSLKKIRLYLKERGVRTNRVVPVGFPKGMFAPIFILEVIRN